MKTAVVAFSGGLDTSFLVPFIREKYGYEKVVTCAVDTGGFSEAERERIAARSAELGADGHVIVDASEQFYAEIIRFLIYGNVTRDGYPLCVGAERLIQARESLNVCREKGATSLVHGCTGAGNDQYRFDLVIHVLGQRGVSGSNEPIKSVAPVREFGISRAFSQDYLKTRGMGVSARADYSYNVGLWGTSIGGRETLVANGILPESAWYTPLDESVRERELVLTFEQGQPIALDCNGRTYAGPLDVIRAVSAIAAPMGIGRHYHVGTSVPGKKGRLGYESPAADVIYAAHRTLESLTLSQAQIFFKKMVADEFGRLIHEARFFDPLIDDLKACLETSQRYVTGTCTIRLQPGRVSSVAVKSPYDLLSVEGSQYGETADAYTGQDAAGSSLLHAYEQILYRRRHRG
jgi:argininosuccinate synthase